MRQAMLLFLSHVLVCVIQKRKFIMLSRIRWLTEYIFCKDNRLVLIAECLLTKASAANAGA